MSTRDRCIALGVLLLLLLLVSGCQRQHCPGCEDPNPIPAVGCPYQASNLTTAFENGTITNPSVLILSGGASHGAWGAGVITGWPTAATAPEPRPDFTIVTGISVGALQATPAFLGTAYDPVLTKFFTTSTNSDIFTSKWNFMFSNSLQSREPLRQIIDDNLTEAVVDAVANQANRELFVGTVNLDTSQFCPWNLSTIARRARDAGLAGDAQKKSCYVDLYRDAVFAASGAPVIAPPVEIDSNACTGGPPKKMLHVDGGVRARVFVGDMVKAATGGGVVPTAYVVMNGKPVTHPECVEDSLLPIALRTFEIMDHEALFGSLHTLMNKNPAPFNLKLSRIPDTYCLKFPGSEFDPVLMKCLYDKGQAWVKQQPIPWETTVPTQSAAPWPANCCRPMGKCTGQVCTAPPGCPP
ncbi:MAG TPA: patatin-like phospholipase family protein [Myxococcota bacterium]|jgi:hypothetical protein